MPEDIIKEEYSKKFDLELDVSKGRLVECMASVFISLSMVMWTNRSTLTKVVSI